MSEKQRLPSSWKTIPTDEFAAGCIQALERGDATEDQQREALKWIIYTACETYEPSYCPGGEEGRRDTDHHEGRRWVGLQIIKHMKVALSKLR
jgi:hypothetical protein